MSGAGCPSRPGAWPDSNNVAKVWRLCRARHNRQSYDTLAAVVTDVLDEDPLSGHVFCFLNRKRDRMKLLVWDRSGFWLFCKRLEAGTFAEVRGGGEGKSVAVSSRELLLLLEGIELRHVRQRKRYVREKLEVS